MHNNGRDDLSTKTMVELLGVLVAAGMFGTQSDMTPRYIRWTVFSSGASS